MVEFGLVLPILLILAVAVGDFGRIFAVGILLESSARNGAELAANEYLAEYPGKDHSPPIPLSVPAPAGDPAYYSALHSRVARAICDETQELPGSTYDPVAGTCPGAPLIMVCIHDSQDTNCSGEVFGATVPAGCSEMSTPPTNTHGGSGTPRWAEVRLCYEFRSVVAVPLVAFGNFWIQRTRTFTIPCYFAFGTADECG